jgi:hypothetical protein
MLDYVYVYNVPFYLEIGAIDNSLTLLPRRFVWKRDKFYKIQELISERGLLLNFDFGWSWKSQSPGKSKNVEKCFL